MLSAMKGAVPTEFWDDWSIKWDDGFMDLYSFLESKKETGIAVGESVAFTVEIKKLEQYLNVQLTKDRLIIDPLAHELISHIIRNDVHQIVMISCFSFDCEEPLAPVTVSKLLTIMDDMKNFWIKFKEVTKEK
jgi:hypothetical protein